MQIRLYAIVIFSLFTAGFSEEKVVDKRFLYPARTLDRRYARFHNEVGGYYDEGKHEYNLRGRSLLGISHVPAADGTFHYYGTGRMDMFLFDHWNTFHNLDYIRRLHNAELGVGIRYAYERETSSDYGIARAGMYRQGLELENSHCQSLGLQLSAGFPFGRSGRYVLTAGCDGRRKEGVEYRETYEINTRKHPAKRSDVSYTEYGNGFDVSCDFGSALLGKVRRRRVYLVQLGAFLDMRFFRYPVNTGSSVSGVLNENTEDEQRLIWFEGDTRNVLAGRIGIHIGEKHPERIPLGNTFHAGFLQLQTNLKLAALEYCWNNEDVLDESVLAWEYGGRKGRMVQSNRISSTKRYLQTRLIARLYLFKRAFIDIDYLSRKYATFTDEDLDVHLEFRGNISAGAQLVRKGRMTIELGHRVTDIAPSFHFEPKADFDLDLYSAGILFLNFNVFHDFPFRK